MALITEQRNYKVKTGQEAKQIASEFLAQHDIPVNLGLAEPNDRYHEWKIPVLSAGGSHIGDMFVYAYMSAVNVARSTEPAILKQRLQHVDDTGTKRRSTKGKYIVSNLQNTVICGDSLIELDKIPEQSIDLVFTSPPYYNARPQYEEYVSYEAYLDFIGQIIKKVSRVLIDGRFFVFNISHVLVSRTSRNESSTRIAVPFDCHKLFMDNGFEFVDDIIWEKPEGAGWASGRGRRFAADRNPLQYKAVPVTEYVLVYRKKSDKLIDWFIRNHPNRQVIQDSKIGDDYEKTNIWKIHPAYSKNHPAIFPLPLAEKVISYYSFKNDVVLDPFGGIGTTALAAAKLGRRYVLIEKEEKYIQHCRESLSC